MSSRKPITPEMALSKGASLCARCEQCTYDIMRKFDRWGLSRRDADAVMLQLEQKGIISDARYAAAYAHDKLVFSGWGARKIAMGLAAKRIPRDMIAEALSTLDKEEYVAVAKRVLSSRLRLTPSLTETYEGKQKLLRFGVQRGFPIALVSGIINQLTSGED